ncbi:glycosyltransferase family 2 protein [Butyrivibrio fibrisolvens]|uniref:Glycosyl transferase family 2 n=1 Tax=Butyrivibrio fibrisolvens TaxID=831 RepID=A0A317FYK3_BUTFI|nr:glycosyltransferase family 2 protein [Butyrivibrio fibrisolvens]PWT26317.1 glycosyl transferase family 2 [Butyrivibrio fibrisolvens]
MERPKITVIIPAYNIENLITRCVESVVKQTYPEELIQILVVDDGSTDDTGRIIDELAEKYSNVTALHESNGGSSRARNYALSKAEGDYIGFVDSDDYIAPFMYEKLVDALIRNNALMAQTGRDEIAEDESRLPDVVQVPEWETIYTDKGFLKELLMHRGDASFCTKLTSRKLFDIDEAVRRFCGSSEDSSFSHVIENTVDSKNVNEDTLNKDTVNEDNVNDDTLNEGTLNKGTLNESTMNREVRLFPEGVLNEDFWLLYHMLPDAGEVVVTTDTGYHVYYRSGSNSRKKATDKDYFPPVFTDIVVNADDVTSFAKDRYPDLVEYTMRFSLVQRLDYLLHIPISKMTDDNGFYQSVCRFVKEHKAEIKENPYLSRRQRLYLRLFTHNPRTIRKVHAFVRRI